MNIDKVVRIGQKSYLSINGRKYSVFCHIEFVDKRLSITGVEGPRQYGNCIGGCGQIELDPDSLASFAPGWDKEQVTKLAFVWDNYHLNDMQAGSPSQTEYLDSLKPWPREVDFYPWACEKLREAGLNPDPNWIHEGKPYQYGSAWLTVKVPEVILDWLNNLPDTDITPAWV